MMIHPSHARAPNAAAARTAPVPLLTLLPGLLALLLLCGLASCASAPTPVAAQPDFAVTTPAGVTSVSLRETPPGMSDAEFAQLIRSGIEKAAPGSVIAGPVAPPFPTQRIVWHVSPSTETGSSRLTVNAFDGARAFAYEQETVADSVPMAVTRSAVDAMSQRIMADIAAHARAPQGS
jgi:hypothetical protein